MNYCLDFSNRVEDELSRLISQLADSRNTDTRNITIKEENVLYQQAFDSTVSSDEGRTMAAGDVRLGEIILLIDCDTRVVSCCSSFSDLQLKKRQPETCLHMGALEMIECPNIAIVQHASGILRVAHNFFETGSE